MLVARPLGSSNKATAICASTDNIGDFVYVNGGKVGAKYSVTKVDVTQRATMPAIAVITGKLNSTECVIQFQGEVPNIYTGLTPGKLYFVGVDGRPSPTSPVAGPGAKAYSQVVGLAVDAAILKLEVITDLKVRVG